ncbi:MAG: GDYXXLXY domain-containing protein [Parvularculaceae bacterium]
MTAPSSHRDNPWYAETFLAIGGWIAGLLAAGAIGAFVATIFTDFTNPRAAAGTGLAIGLAFVLLGSRMGRAGSGDFRRHFAISMIAAGLTAATASTWYLVWSILDGDGKGVVGSGATVGHAGLVTALLFIPAAALAARAVKDGILTFLTTSAWFWIVGFALMTLVDEKPWGPTALQTFPPASAVLGLGLFTGDQSRRRAAVGAALLIAPMIFYLTLRGGIGFLGIEAFQAGTAANFVFAAGAVYCLIRLRDRYPLWGLLAGTALISAGIWLLPDSGAIAILILLAGMAAGHRGLAAVGVVALAWFVGKFYYDLSMTLLQKSAVLAGLGAATLAGALIARRLEAGASASPIAMAGRRPILASLAFGALLLGSLALVNRSVLRLESDFREARDIYLPLGPVDPRSLIQGDYMVLAFRETIYPEFEAIEALPARGEVFLKLDGDGVAAFSRVAGAGDTPGPDEIRIDYTKEASGLRYCPTSYFFQEGEAEIFNAARFAVLRVAPDGKTRLAALADSERKIIQPQ